MLENLERTYQLLGVLGLDRTIQIQNLGDGMYQFSVGGRDGRAKGAEEALALLRGDLEMMARAKLEGLRKGIETLAKIVG